MSAINKQVLEVFTKIWEAYRRNPIPNTTSDISFEDVYTSGINVRNKFNITIQDINKNFTHVISVYKVEDEDEITAKLLSRKFDIDETHHLSSTTTEQILKVNDYKIITFDGDKLSIIQ